MKYSLFVIIPIFLVAAASSSAQTPRKKGKTDSLQHDTFPEGYGDIDAQTILKELQNISNEEAMSPEDYERLLEDAQKDSEEAIRAPDTEPENGKREFKIKDSPPAPVVDNTEGGSVKRPAYIEPEIKKCKLSSECGFSDEGVEQRCVRGRCIDVECSVQAQCGRHELCAQGVCHSLLEVKKNLGTNLDQKLSGCKEHCKNCKKGRFIRSSSDHSVVHNYCVECEKEADCRRGFACEAFRCVSL